MPDMKSNGNDKKFYELKESYVLKCKYMLVCAHFNERAVGFNWFI